MPDADHARTAGTFYQGIRYLGEPSDSLERYGTRPVIDPSREQSYRPFSDEYVYQTVLGADALRYLTMQMTATKSSGHPGGFMSSAEAVAAVMMLGYKNMVTEVGHHAPGYYSAMFLDASLERMGIYTVEDLDARFRERGGLLGHVTGAIPGVLSPAGPLGQGQHFAMAGAYLHPDILFPVTLGDGGFGEPYVMSAFRHFRTLFPKVTNYLPVLVWNGFSQEHHSIVSLDSNKAMLSFWKSHGFEQVFLVDARDFDQSNNGTAYSDSTQFDLDARMGFTRAVLETIALAADGALNGTATAVIIKQLKGSGGHATGAKAHNLNPGQTLESDVIIKALERLALPPRAWEIVRENFKAAGGGPAAEVAVTEREYPLEPIGDLPLEEYDAGTKQVPTTAFGRLVAAAGTKDSKYLVTNADGNQASGMMNINQTLGVRHPTQDDLYSQRPDGRVYEPLSEDACAGLAAAVSLMGGRSLWCSYESFVINGLPILHTVTQAMAELRRPTPSAVALFTAGALEQGRNGWTHQRPEVEGYIASMMRNGNVFPLFPIDANSIQACYEWALATRNLGVPIFASKTALPIRTTLTAARRAIETGIVVLREGNASDGTKASITIATVGDIVLLPVMQAADRLEREGISVRIVGVVSPRRLLRGDDLLADHKEGETGSILDDTSFETAFGSAPILGVTGGASAMLEPVALRASGSFDVISWKRGETTASAGELLELNGMDAAGIVERARRLVLGKP